MINIKVTTVGEDENFTLVVDDVEITKEMGYIFRSRRSNGFLAAVYDYELSRRAANIPFQNIPDHISEIGLFLPVEFSELAEEIEINISVIRIEEDPSSFRLSFQIRFEWEIWKQPWSLKEFVQAMEEVVESNQNDMIRWEQNDKESVSNGFKIIFTVEDSSRQIYAEYENNIPVLKKLYDEATSLLLTRMKENSLMVSFDFPEPVRVPCEQYLLYFSQFLREIGLETVTSIQHEAGKVLFSVEPESKEAALEKIYEALGFFLNLPRMINVGIGWQGQMEIPEQQLVANVQFLQSQLMLAKATIQAQDYTIRNQQSLIEQQNRINDRVMQDSMRYITDGKKIEDKETFLGGMIAVKKVEIKGVEIDTPNLYRWIKEKLINK